MGFCWSSELELDKEALLGSRKGCFSGPSSGSDWGREAVGVVRSPGTEVGDGGSGARGEIVAAKVEARVAGSLFNWGSGATSGTAGEDSGGSSCVGCGAGRSCVRAAVGATSVTSWEKGAVGSAADEIGGVRARGVGLDVDSRSGSD